VAAVILIALAASLLPIEPPSKLNPVLSVLWQVQAAILGLAVAVAIFAYQSMHRATGSRRRLILLTSFPTAMVSGIALVIITGAAFAGGDARWAAWLGTFSIALSAPWLLLLMLSVADAPHLSDQRYALRMRLRVLRAMTSQAVGEHVVARAGVEVLDSLMKAEEGALQVWVDDDDPEHRIGAGRSGVLVDVSLARLREAARDLKAAGGRLEIGALQLGMYLRPLSTIAVGTVEVPEAVRDRVRDSLVVGRAETVSLADDLSDLHDDALQAVESAPDLVDAVLSAYLQVLEDYAAGWKNFSLNLGNEQLPQWPEAMAAPTVDIRKSVLRLFQESLERRARDSASHLAYFPVDLLQRSIQWRAPAYFSLLQLAPSYYWLASQDTVPGDMRAAFRERSWRHLAEAMELLLPGLAKRLGEDYSPLIDRARVALDETMFAVLRAAVRNGDWQTFSEGLRRWRIATR
jgi:hypothetical protein